MTDTEYDILDELYFVTPYHDLKEQSGIEDEVLQANLINLVSDGLVKVYRSMEVELDSGSVDMEESYRNYFYLASKKGLFEHNQR